MKPVTLHEQHFTKANRKRVSNADTFVSPLTATMLSGCKQSYTTRNVERDIMRTLITGHRKPQPGDLCLATVTRVRQHTRVELVNGRRSRMFVGDQLLLAYGSRYAPDQFESVVPDDLGACHLVAGGGIASRMRKRSPSVKPATEITPIGFIGDSHGQVINLRCHRLTQLATVSAKLQVFLIVGSSMNAGKTTTAASLVKGLTSSGLKVGAAKVTGTGSGGDIWHFTDAGAVRALDFTDAGHATTYQVSSEDVESIYVTLLSQLQSDGAQAVVVEIADGVLQQETASLLEALSGKSEIAGVIYAASDSTSALHGVSHLERLGHHVLGVSGKVSSNPLGIEEIIHHCEAPVWTKSDLRSAEIVTLLTQDCDHTETRQFSVS